MNATLRTVRVELGPRSYTIHIGTGVLAQAERPLLEDRPRTHVVLVADERVERLYAAPLQKRFEGVGLRVNRLTVPSGEGSKSVEQAARLWEQLLDCGADRRSVVVAVGGGVLGDVAGFVAATFARGVDFWQVPTTLLAQVDSSVGGKVGINLPQAKNMVGAFWQPRGVLIDTATLETLPDREYRAGLAEVVKYGMILDADFFAELEESAEGLMTRRPDLLVRAIARSCELKAQIVAEDEREETGRRAVLNYGHTFAHALETVAGYGTWLHGEAVSVGMVCAARLAVRLGRIEAGVAERQRRLLVALGLPVTLLDVDQRKLLAAMMHDKKVEHGKLRLVLPSRLGSVELVGNVPESDVSAALGG